MQLFTIGLYKLNPDGTPIRDPTTGQKLETYDNVDIMNFARAWTGFDRQTFRSNLEAYTGAGTKNKVDPMQIKQSWRVSQHHSCMQPIN